MRRVAAFLVLLLAAATPAWAQCSSGNLPACPSPTLNNVTANSMNVTTFSTNSLNNTPIGNTTPSTGAFTTLKANTVTASNNVVFNGADPTGVADSATAINATITAACAASPPLAVQIPAGTFLLTHNIQNLCSGLKISGAGQGVTTLKVGPGNANTFPAIAFSSPSNVTISNLTIDGNVSGLTGGGGSLNRGVVVSIFRGTGVVFDGVAFQNTLGQALQFSQSALSGIRNSSFTNIGQYWNTSGLSTDARQPISFVASGGGVTGSISADGAGTGSGTILNVTALVSNGAAVQVGAAVIVAGVAVAHIVACVPGGSQTCSGVSGTGLYQIDTSLNEGAGTTINIDPSDLYYSDFVENVTITNAGLDPVNGNWLRNFRVQNVHCNLGSGPSGTALPTLEYANPANKIGGACVFVYGVKGLTLSNVDSEVASGNGFEVNGASSIVMTGNQSNFSSWAGFFFGTGNPYGTSYGVNGFTFANNIARNNNQAPLGAVTYTAGLSFGNADVTTYLVQNGVVTGNIFDDDQASSTQAFGIAQQGTGSLNIVDNSVKFPATNVMDGNVTAPYVGILSLHSGNSLYSANAGSTMAAASAVTCYAPGGNGSQNIPASSVVVGTTFRLSCLGRYTTPGSSPGTMTINIKYGASTVISATTPTLAVSQTASPFTATATCTVRTLGTSGTMACNGLVQFFDASGNAASVGIASATPGTINTASTGAMDMLFAWSTIAGSQTATSSQATLEMLN